MCEQQLQVERYLSVQFTGDLKPGQCLTAYSTASEVIGMIANDRKDLHTQCTSHQYVQTSDTTVLLGPHTTIKRRSYWNMFNIALHIWHAAAAVRKATRIIRIIKVTDQSQSHQSVQTVNISLNSMFTW